MIRVSRAELLRSMQLGSLGHVKEIRRSDMYVAEGVLVIPAVMVLPLHLVGRMDMVVAQEPDAAEKLPSAPAAGRARKT